MARCILAKGEMTIEQSATQRIALGEAAMAALPLLRPPPSTPFSTTP